MPPGKRTQKGLPMVAIVGRPNVGKSTLFNRIIGKQRAIVHDVEGITRDRFINEAAWDGRRFRLVDTGGIVEIPVDEITRKMQAQVQQAIEEACVVIFVLDGQQEITRPDRAVCETLQRCGKPVVLAVNKLDNPQLAMNQYEYYALGIGEPHAISSGHNLGIDALMGEVTRHLPAPGEGEQDAADDGNGEGVSKSADDIIKVAIIGRPNVGKSSFVNALLNEERTIVSDVPGTTRDAIDIEFHRRDKNYLLIDTAGLRRKAGIRKPVEHFSVARALRAIRRADVCLVMVEATEELSEQDKRIIGYALEQGTAFILVWTKWDLVENAERRLKALEDDLDLKMPQIQFAPRITISNVTRKRLFSVFDCVDRVAAEAAKRIGTAELNRLMEQIKAKHNPPGKKGVHAKILYATQTGVKPTEIVLFVNQKRLFHFSYLRFIENQIREAYGFEGVPLKLELREEKKKI
ncbi:MAG TPA: ribosome biogenesis GTPase Der [Candidatus Hydrogenedentes bacterium]|jgi:GTP-binding protein|nr:ribosome biogenesis GTPase Der [Candidatus Hydrogenedentota bacterium]HOC69446.1 ribosome biogenesis GTPase Der [Candidatus Hydrogenedentota bacterium]HOH28284.1 ribosome biogenesis GTPase Der [Candidatus Hydrogenedentota bacterium]